MTAFTCTAFLLVALLVAFLASVDYTPGLRIYAYIDSRSGLVRLKAPIDGRILSIAVKEGQRVRAGDTIAVISHDREQADGASQHTEIRMKLAQERDLLDREMENARLEAVAARLVNERRIAGLRSEQATLATDLQAVSLASCATVERRVGLHISAQFCKGRKFLQESRVESIALRSA